jgi:peptide chain release factor 1
MREIVFSVTKKDFEITYFSGTGAGGQHRNKHMNCVRIHHPDSGVTATGQSERSLEQNKKEAFRGVVNNPKFKFWLKRKYHEALMTANEKRELERQIEKAVEEQMQEKYLLIEEL